MAAEEKAERADTMRKIVEKADVRRWFYNQLEDALRASKSQANSAATS